MVWWIHLSRVCLARYVTTSGFFYPLAVLLPISPLRSFFVPKTPLGFTLQSISHKRISFPFRGRCLSCRFHHQILFLPGVGNRCKHLSPSAGGKIFGVATPEVYSPNVGWLRHYGCFTVASFRLTLLGLCLSRALSSIDSLSVSRKIPSWGFFLLWHQLPRKALKFQKRTASSGLLKQSTRHLSLWEIAGSPEVFHLFDCSAALNKIRFWPIFLPHKSSYRRR